MDVEISLWIAFWRSHLDWAACPDGADYKLDRIGKQGSLIFRNDACGCVEDRLINGAAQSNDSVVRCLILMRFGFGFPKSVKQAD